MKKLFASLTIIFINIVFILNVEAASFNASASVGSVAPGGSFTVTVGGDAIGRVDLSVSNGTLSTSSVWVEQNTQVITVTAGASGVVTVTAIPAVGFSDADANIYNPGARSVSVTINSGGNGGTTSPSNPGTPTAPTKKKSSNNLLSSLEVDKGELTPSFKGEITEYTINLTKDVTVLKIDAKPEDNTAKVSGAGEIKVKPGLNTIVVIVTAENGAKRNYTIKAYVDETPSLYLEYGGFEVGIVKNLDGVELEGFKKEEYELEGEKIVLFKRDDLSLIYAISEDGKKNFYRFDDENKKIEDKVFLVTIANKNYTLIEKSDSEHRQVMITIFDQEVTAYETNSEDYYFIYILDDEGEVREYLYDAKEETIQRYASELFEGSTCEERKSVDKVIIIIESLVILLFLGLTIFLYRNMRMGK